MKKVRIICGFCAVSLVGVTFAVADEAAARRVPAANADVTLLRELEKRPEVKVPDAVPGEDVTLPTMNYAQPSLPAPGTPRTVKKEAPKSSPHRVEKPGVTDTPAAAVPGAGVTRTGTPPAAVAAPGAGATRAVTPPAAVTAPGTGATRTGTAPAVTAPGAGGTRSAAPGAGTVDARTPTGLSDYDDLGDDDPLSGFSGGLPPMTVPGGAMPAVDDLDDEILPHGLPAVTDDGLGGPGGVLSPGATRVDTPFGAEAPGGVRAPAFSDERASVPDRLPAADAKTPATKTPEELAAQSAVARELLSRLTAVPASTLENVEQISLEEFLGRISGGDDALRAAVRAYWEAADSAGAYAYWKNQVDFLNKQASGARGVSADMRAAQSAAQTAMNDALATLRANAVRLGEMAGYSREIWPADMPHAGAYNTQYEKMAEQGDGSPRLEMLNRIVDLRWQQWNAAGAAYRAAEYVRQEVAKTGVPGEILQASWAVEQRREMLFKSLIQYNMDILDYVLAVSGKRGSALAPLLVVAKKPEAASPDTAPAFAPEGGRETPRADSGRPAAPPESVLAPGSAVRPGAGVVTPPRLPTENGTLPADDYLPADEMDDPGFSGDMYLMPGAGMPPLEETPPHGRSFERIGGETGSDASLPSVAPDPVVPGGRPRSSLKPVLPAEGASAKTGEIPYTSAKIPLSASLESLNSGKTPPGKALSLEDVFRRVSVSQREQAAKDYWRYSVLQAQLVVLNYQADILASLGRDQLQNPTTAADTLSGLRLTAAVETLNAQRLGLEADAFRVLMRLDRAGALAPGQRTALPMAVSRPNTGKYDLRLDTLAPGSAYHDRALQLARHLEFCVALCAEADKKLEDLGQLVPPGADDGLPPTVAQKDFPAFFTALENARTATGNYLRLVYTLNSALVSGTFMNASVAQLPATELSRRLCGNGK